MITFWRCLRLYAFMLLLTGVIYPLLVTGFAYIAFNDKANGSMITSQGRVIGSSLIAQKFEDPKYFWSRPSAVNYNPLPSGGSNLSPTSAVLKKTVEERRQYILKTHETNDITTIPSSLIFASGSGLDPHIRVKAAYFQIDRITKARGLNEAEDKEKIKKLIDSMSSHSYINVLLLNLALNKEYSDPGETKAKR